MITATLKFDEVTRIELGASEGDVHLEIKTSTETINLYLSPKDVKELCWGMDLIVTQIRAQDA